MLYRLINGNDHACVEAVKRLAADAISNNNSSSSTDNTKTSDKDSMHILTALSYHTNDDANTDDREMLQRLFITNTTPESASSNITSIPTITGSALRAAVSKRLIDDVAFVKRIDRVPESQNLDIKALFKSGKSIIYIYNILTYIYTNTSCVFIYHVMLIYYEFVLF